MRKIVKRLTKKDKRESNRDIEKIEQLKQNIDMMKRKHKYK